MEENKKAGLNIYTSSVIKEIKKVGDKYSVITDKNVVIENVDCVLSAIGRVPNVDGISIY